MSHQGHSCEGDHDHDDTPEMGIQYSLYEKIDMDAVECLNEQIDGSGKTIFKPWEERLDVSKVNDSHGFRRIFPLQSNHFASCNRFDVLRSLDLSSPISIIFCMLF